jgi:hypothetical protein
MRHETRVFVGIEVRGEECLTLAFCPIFLQGYEWCQVINAVWLYVNAPGKQSKTISGVNKTIKVKALHRRSLALVSVAWAHHKLLA